MSVLFVARPGSSMVKVAALLAVEAEELCDGVAINDGEFWLASPLPT